MGILITKRKQMRKLFIRTLALALCLTGTAQALRAQETTAAQTAVTYIIDIINISAKEVR